MPGTCRRSVPLLVALALTVAAGACSGGGATAPEATLPTTTTDAPGASSATTGGDDGESAAGSSGGEGQPAGRASGSLPPAEAASCEVRPAEGVSRFDVDAGGVTSRIRVFVPARDDDARLPVVIDWHGLGSDGAQQALLTGYEELAGREGFVAVHPTGPRGGGGQTSWELVQLDIPGRDDVALAAAIIDRLVGEYCVDPDRVYSTGMSNGGFFTSRLVCELADRIAAAVSVAGVSHPEDCRPARAVPYLAFHGTADRIVPYAGGTSSLQIGPSTPAVEAFFAQVMPDEFAEFAADFGCDPEPSATPIGDDVIRHDYTGCDGAVPLAFHEIDGGGHTWPGSPLGPVLAGALGRTTSDVDATADGWAFMSRFTLDGEG